MQLSRTKTRFRLEIRSWISRQLQALGSRVYIPCAQLPRVITFIVCASLIYGLNIWGGAGGGGQPVSRLLAGTFLSRLSQKGAAPLFSDVVTPGRVSGASPGALCPPECPPESSAQRRPLRPHRLPLPPPRYPRRQTRTDTSPHRGPHAWGGGGLGGWGGVRGVGR